MYQSAIWHPYEMPDKNQLFITPLTVESAQGSILYLKDGKTIIDAISSWWIMIHGHCHPKITLAIQEQAKKLHQVMFAGFSHLPAQTLANKIISVLPENQKKIFFSDNGSTAVEVALKLCIQYWKNQNIKRTKIIALENGYHGDTFGAMSAGARSVFTHPFEDYLFEVSFLDSIDTNPQKTIEQLKQLIKKENICAFIFEPLVQGAGGMIMHQPWVLDELMYLCKKNDIPCIADEVMTGFGKTGKFFASDYLKNKPDLICLSKALTGGSLPLAITSCTEEIYSAFDFTSRDKGFFHGHTYTANPLACASANASFEILSDINYFSNIGRIYQKHLGFIELLKNTSKITNPRTQGVILAFEITSNSKDYNNYLDPIRDKIMSFCLAEGVLIRPLGNTVYILPPYCTTDQQLLQIYDTILGAIDYI